MSGLADLVANVLETLWPPTDAAPEKQYQWRVRVALVACVTLFGSILLWSWYFRYRYPEVATRAEMVDGDRTLQHEIAQVLATLNQTEAARVRSRIVDLDLARCAMRRESKQRDMYDNELDKAVANYQKLAEDPTYTATPCSGL